MERPVTALPGLHCSSSVAVQRTRCAGAALGLCDRESTRKTPALGAAPTRVGHSLPSLLLDGNRFLHELPCPILPKDRNTTPDLGYSSGLGFSQLRHNVPCHLTDALGQLVVAAWCLLTAVCWQHDSTAEVQCLSWCLGHEGERAIRRAR